MNYDELNEYIKHYIEKDKTKSAIMLTGAWGTGKSYYIRNVLEPFLKENGKHRCAVVSLYGLKNTSEISKRIYFELRTMGSSKKSEALSTAKAAATIVAKTVLNGMTNMIGFDIGRISDEELENVYSSIDLSNALVVFEDLERSNIDVIDILGYVNSLTEQDGAKVLLIANEDEILKYYDSQPDKDGKTYKIPDEKTIMYLKAKEKTVNDTIVFNSDYKSAIKNIISKSFENLKRFESDENIEDILGIMESLQNYNLRSFIFACQKTVDIYEKLYILNNITVDIYERLDILNSIEEYFIKTIFYGIIAFSLRIKYGEFPKWDGNGSTSKSLGVDDYPLYIFCYDYIKEQQFEVDKAMEALSKHKMQRLLVEDDFKNDMGLSVIFDYHLNSEKDIKSALSSVENRLQNFDDIPFYCYEKLAYYLIRCNTILKFDYSLCKERMLHNICRICDKENETICSKIFSWTIDRGFDNECEKEQFKDFSNDVIKAWKSISISREKAHFLYEPENIINLHIDVIRNTEQIISSRSFISRFDLIKLADMIFKSTPYQIHLFRDTLNKVYTAVHNNDFLDDDCIFMENLRSWLKSDIEKQPSSIDKVQLLQIRALIDDLSQFISQQSYFKNTYK